MFEGALTEIEVARIYRNTYPNKRGCLLWDGAVNQDDVPVMSFRGKTMAVRTVLDLYLDRCSVPDTPCSIKLCVNPDHYRERKRAGLPDGLKARSSL